MTLPEFNPISVLEIIWDRRLFCAVTVLGMLLLCTALLGTILYVFRDGQSAWDGFKNDVRYVVGVARGSMIRVKDAVKSTTAR